MKTDSRNTWQMQKLFLRLCIPNGYYFLHKKDYNTHLICLTIKRSLFPTIYYENKSNSSKDAINVSDIDSEFYIYVLPTRHDKYSNKSHLSVLYIPNQKRKSRPPWLRKRSWHLTTPIKTLSHRDHPLVKNVPINNIIKLTVTIRL